jgi:hypothetical protein
MDLSTVLAAAPLVRKAWKLIPGPLRIPLLVGAAVVWVWQRDDGVADADA